MRRITVGSQPRQSVPKTQKTPSQKKWAGGVAQGVGPVLQIPVLQKEKKKKQELGIWLKW
jgi:hypothetical protein